MRNLLYYHFAWPGDEPVIRQLPPIAALAVLLGSLACSGNSPRTDAVKAGFFNKVEYDPKPRLMTIYFTDGSVYTYDKVPAKVYTQLVKSASPGSFFNKNIMGSYTSELIHLRTAPYGYSRLSKKLASPDPFPCLLPGANRIPLKPVKSVILDFAAYDAGDACLILYFDKGYVYEYGGVPRGVFNALVNSRNIDKFFNEQIWGKYPKRQIQRP
jgi:KTSC domain